MDCLFENRRGKDYPTEHSIDILTSKSLRIVFLDSDPVKIINELQQERNRIYDIYNGLLSGLLLFGYDNQKKTLEEAKQEYNGYIEKIDNTIYEILQKKYPDDSNVNRAIQKIRSIVNINDVNTGIYAIEFLENEKEKLQFYLNWTLKSFTDVKDTTLNIIKEEFAAYFRKIDKAIVEIDNNFK